MICEFFVLVENDRRVIVYVDDRCGGITREGIESMSDSDQKELLFSVIALRQWCGDDNCTVDVDKVTLLDNVDFTEEIEIMLPAGMVKLRDIVRLSATVVGCESRKSS